MTSQHSLPQGVTLTIGEDGLELFADLQGGNTAWVPDEQWLHDALEQRGCPGVRLFHDALLKLRRKVASGESGRVPLGQCVDGDVRVLVSNNRLEAEVVLHTAQGGRQPTLETVMETLATAKVPADRIDRQALDDLLAAVPAAVPGSELRAPVARGIAAVHGTDSRFELLVTLDDRRPRARADGTLDYWDRGAIPTVEVGQALLRRHPPTQGQDGLSVTGEIIAAKPGQRREFQRCKGAAPSPQDADLLAATVTGQPVIGRSGVSVDPVLRVKQVNLRTGHILYDGTLIVEGDIDPGMRIEVTGDVQVFGTVESADIQAGGNVDVKSGIIGVPEERRQPDQCMRVRCAGNLLAGFIEHAEIEAGGDVLVKSRVAHSRIQTQHQIAVGSSGQPRSGIVGGRVEAGTLIRTESLGADAGVQTHAAIVCDATLLAEYRDILATIQTKNDQLGQLLKVMVQLAKTATENGREQLQRIKTTGDALKQEIGELIRRRDELKTSIDRVALGRIEVRGSAYPKVTVGLMDQVFEVKAYLDRVAFVIDQGAIRARRLTG